MLEKKKEIALRSSERHTPAGIAINRSHRKLEIGQGLDFLLRLTRETTCPIFLMSSEVWAPELQALGMDGLLQFPAGVWLPNFRQTS